MMLGYFRYFLNGHFNVPKKGKISMFQRKEKKQKKKKTIFAMYAYKLVWATVNVLVIWMSWYLSIASLFFRTQIMLY